MKIILFILVFALIGCDTKEGETYIDYTGESVRVTITSILENFEGLEKGYCIMSTRRILL